MSRHLVRLACALGLATLVHAGAARATAEETQPARPGPASPLTRGTDTGLKLPRFAALKSDDVNLRMGPGLRYPIAWVYHRRLLPVLIVREFHAWRQIRTVDHGEGWVHQALLTGARSFVVTAPPMVLLHARPSLASRVVAHLQQGVVGRILACTAGAAWCRVEAGGHDGYLRRAAFFGTLPGEAVAQNP